MDMGCCVPSVASDLIRLMRSMDGCRGLGRNDVMQKTSVAALAGCYAFRLLMLCAVFRITADFDSLADLFCCGDWYRYVPVVNFILALQILLNLLEDFRLRLRVGYWARNSRIAPKCWRWEMVAWAVVLLMMLLMFKKVNTETVAGVTWRYEVLDGKAIITRGRNHNSRAAISALTSGHLTIPAALGGYPVSGIGEFAFHNCRNLESVSLPEGLRWIGLEAFNGCERLTAVTMPDSVTHIHYEAFRGCRNLTSVTIPANVIFIDETAFDGTPFLDNATDGLLAFSGIAYRWKGKCPAEVVIPEDVSRVFCRAFERRFGLETLTIGNSVTNVGDMAFHGCSNLKSVVLGTQVSSIGGRAFYACFKLSSVSIPRSLTSVGEEAFRGCPIKTVYVEKCDAERVKELLWGKGVDVDKAEFVERDDALSFSHSGEVVCGPGRSAEVEYKKEK